MSLIHLLSIALGLSADAFAVATAEGVLLRKSSKHRHSFRVGLVFGLCQGVMPLLGWLAGNSFHALLGPWADLAACLVLTSVGAKMILNALKTENPSGGKAHSVGFKLWVLGMAVSIDALGVGVSIGVSGISVWLPALVIGIVTAAVCVAGVQTGGRLGHTAGERAEFAGGVVLIAIGISFLF